MIDDFESQEERSSGELWSEICSRLPEVQCPGNNVDFKDSFQPETPIGAQVNGQSNDTTTRSPSAKWEPMEDSEIYIAGLGIVLLLFVPLMVGLSSFEANLVFHPPWDNTASDPLKSRRTSLCLKLSLPLVFQKIKSTKIY